MPLIRRRPPQLLPLQLPRLDNTTWPDRRDVGRQSFGASALYQLGYREAFAPESHDITDLLLDQVLPMLRTGAAPEDEPYLGRVLSSAAQIGAGIGIVERRVVQNDELGTDRQIAGALWMAAGDLPSMQPQQQGVALYLLQCGYYLARTDLTRIPLLLAALHHDDQPGAEPGP
ncbi:MAG TPA: hypothetical protein VFD59_06470 [Nocardioidaceae bacterium]|nr:hypothetical protein [Nocardioidaceae bacterium]